MPNVGTKFHVVWECLLLLSRIFETTREAGTDDPIHELTLQGSDRDQLVFLWTLSRVVTVNVVVPEREELVSWLRPRQPTLENCINQPRSRSAAQC